MDVGGRGRRDEEEKMVEERMEGMRGVRMGEDGRKRRKKMVGGGRWQEEEDGKRRKMLWWRKMWWRFVIC